MSERSDDLMAEAFDWIAVGADRSGQSRAQLDVASGRQFNYSQMHERVGRLAAHFLSLRVSKGDRVGYLMRNSSDVFEVIFACWRIGVVAVALNWRLTADELNFIISDAEPAVVVFDRELGALVEELRRRNAVESWIETAADGTESDYERCLSGAEPLLKMPFRPALADTCMLMYSSGTTGRPKGVRITYQMELFFGWATIADTRITSDSVSLCFIPLFHIGGANGVVAPAFLAGGAVVIVREFSADIVLGLIDQPELGVSHLVGVPAIFDSLLAHPAAARTDFSRITTSFVGASSVSPHLMHAWKKRGLFLREGYGLTETAGAGISMPVQEVGCRTDVSGKAAPSFDLKIMRPDFTEAEIDEPGELWMRGPLVTPGYWRRPDADQESFTGDWFRTGDIASRDIDNFFKIHDRLKDMYISGGENVYPAEVENVLSALPQISEVSVIGLPDPRWGESGCAVVVLQPDSQLDINDLRSFLRNKIAKFKIPTSLVIMAALPRTASGKVQKNVLRTELVSRPPLV